eukprot:SAG22_NODE_6821_length_807_cov_1.310734_1_plen_60_part_01
MLGSYYGDLLTFLTVAFSEWFRARSHLSTFFVVVDSADTLFCLDLHDFRCAVFGCSPNHA